VKVVKFAIDHGIYNFKLNDVKTEFHSLPVIKVVIARKGLFSVETLQSKFDNISFL